MNHLYEEVLDNYDNDDLRQEERRKQAEKLLASDPDDGIMHQDTLYRLEAIADCSQADVDLDALLEGRFKTVAGKV